MFSSSSSSSRVYPASSRRRADFGVISLAAKNNIGQAGSAHANPRTRNLIERARLACERPGVAAAAPDLTSIPHSDANQRRLTHWRPAGRMLADGNLQLSSPVHPPTESIKMEANKVDAEQTSSRPAGARLAVPILISAAILLVVSASPSGGARDELMGFSCHLRELELCVVGAASLLQNPNGIPVTDREFKRQCEFLRESVDCFENYANKCLTNKQNLLLEMFAGSLEKLEKEFCTNGTDLQRSYMEHASCLRDVQRKHQRKCVTDLQVGFESIHKIDHSLRWPTGCWIEQDCGEGALALTQLIIERSLGSTLSVACRQFDPTSPNCTSLLPKAGTKPYNGRNTSAISRVISSYANAQA